jgi:hypothetical protein
MKIIFTLFCFFQMEFHLFSQESADSSFYILAKHINYLGGDKIHFSTFKIFKDLSETNIRFPDYMFQDTFYIGYYPNNSQFANQVYLLRIEKWGNGKGYFKFPNYNVNNNYEEVDLIIIGKEYWENCEKGNSCKDLELVKRTNRKLFLLAPCGGSFTTINLKGDKVVDKSLYYDAFSCPPCIEFSSLTEGAYTLGMLGCGLGGTIKFNLLTK